MIVTRVLLAALLFVLGAGLAAAQVELQAAAQNRPPVAAPTSQIEVAPIQVVRSMAEVIGDYGGGLIEGLLASRGLPSATLIAVQDSRIIVTETFGCCPKAPASIGQRFADHVLAEVAVMQLAEQQRVNLSGPFRASDSTTAAEVLTHYDDPALLRDIVETASGMPLGDYLRRNVVAPLGGNDPQQIIGRLLVALLNEGSFEGGQLLQPESVRLMTQTQHSIHPALPGWSYGFAELRRNGWRAFQWDGLYSESPEADARMVVIPEANLAYFIHVEGRAGTAFWRTLDDALFDRILPPRDAPIAELPQRPAPDPGSARAAAGAYEAVDERLAWAAPLKMARRVIVRAAEDGSLILSGGEEDAVLMPRAGDYWATADGNLTAVAIPGSGGLHLGNALYVPLAPWKRPGPYAALAVVAGLGAGAMFYTERRTQRRKPARSIGVVLAVAAGTLLATALFVWHFFSSL